MLAPGELLSLIVPVYYEEECIEQFILETCQELDRNAIAYEIVFIDDGSRDRTVELIKTAAAHNPRLRLVELSYNHGKNAALTAGFEHAQGDYLLMMDPDLQDPPYEIPRFITEIQKGYDLVFGVRREKKDSWKNTRMSNIFWWTLDKFTGLNIPRGLAVMRIFNRKFTDQLLRYREENRFLEGMFMHVGMRRTTIPVDQRERFAGVSKFNFRRKMQLAINAIFDFSELPLKLAVNFGLSLTAIGLLAAFGLLITRLFFFEFQLGWPSIMVTLMIGFGLQIFFTGVAAIYIGKIYKESKRRPLYSVRELTNLEGTYQGRTRE